MIYRVLEEDPPLVAIDHDGTLLLIIGPETTLAFRTTASFERWLEDVDRGYPAARESWCRGLYPQLFGDEADRLIASLEAEAHPEAAS